MDVTMELLIIRCGDRYIREKETTYQCCEINEASVYALDHLPAVKRHATTLRRQGFGDVSIRKLSITEEALDG
jgi:hypothetical protein